MSQEKRIIEVLLCPKKKITIVFFNFQEFSLIFGNNMNMVRFPILSDLYWGIVSIFHRNSQGNIIIEYCSRKL